MWKRSKKFWTEVCKRFLTRKKRDIWRLNNIFSLFFRTSSPLLLLLLLLLLLVPIFSFFVFLTISDFAPSWLFFPTCLCLLPKIKRKKSCGFAKLVTIHCISSLTNKIQMSSSIFASSVSNLLSDQMLFARYSRVKMFEQRQPTTICFPPS